MMLTKKRKGIIFVLSSPSGGGKTTLCRALKKERFNVVFSVSATTRKPRPGEKNGRDYIFLDKDEFKRRLLRRNFLEWTDNFGDLYGTPKRFVMETVAKNRDIILAIDVKGAMRVKRILRGAVLIFVLPPSLGLLKRRLKARKTETKEAERRRLSIAEGELGCYKKYDYAIVNDEVTKTVARLKSIIIAERHRVNR